MRYIDINTTQHVTIRYELASLRERAMAAAIDLIVMISFVTLLTGILYLLVGRGDMLKLLSLFITTPLAVGFTFICEMSMNGQTPGKKAMAIKVAKLNGKLPALSDYFLRWVFRAVDLYFSAGGIGSLLISTSSHSQRLGDILAGTSVIRLRTQLNYKLEDLLSIHSRENYEPMYPAVIQLSEADMLLVKAMLHRISNFPNKAHQLAMDAMVQKIKSELKIEEPIRDQKKFLRTLIDDYVALTR